MLKYMLDTNICIFTIKNKPQTVRETFERQHGRLALRVDCHPSHCVTIPMKPAPTTNSHQLNRELKFNHTEPN